MTAVDSTRTADVRAFTFDFSDEQLANLRPRITATKVAEVCGDVVAQVVADTVGVPTGRARAGTACRASRAHRRARRCCEVGTGRGVGLAVGPFPWAACRTGRARRGYPALQESCQAA
jgi:hypothetical protein